MRLENTKLEQKSHAITEQLKDHKSDEV